MHPGNGPDAAEQWESRDNVKKMKWAVFDLGTLVMGLWAMKLRQKTELAYDWKGLFDWGHPAAEGLVWVSGLFLLGLCLLTWTWVREEDRVGLGSGWLRGSLSVLAGVLLALDMSHGLSSIPRGYLLTALLAGAAMILGGMWQMLGKSSRGLFPGAVCLFYLSSLLYSYRIWGANSHLERFLFPLVGGIGAMIFALHRAEAEAGTSRRRRSVISGYTAIFCAVIAMAEPSSRIFALSVILWTLGNLCPIDPEQQPRTEEAQP